MYRLLIVDDLPIIVDGLIELFEQSHDMDLDILKAYSGEEALEVLQNNRVDIVISDIKMPGLEGIELLQEIKAQWPACKVIFLTGYNDFHYVQSAVTYGSFEYLLKIESDEKIIRSVQRAIEKFEEEYDQLQMFERANNRMRLALPSLQKDYISGLLQGKSVTSSQLENHFKEIDMPLRTDMPVFLLLGRVDGWRDMITAPDKALLIYAMQNVTEEFLSPRVRSYSYVYDQSKIVWFIQPLDVSDAPTPHDSSDLQWKQTSTYVSGMLEKIQRTCKKLLQLPVSFILSSEHTAWSGVFERFHSLKYGFVYGMGLSSEVILSDSDIRRSEEGTAADKQNDFFHYTRVQLLAKSLENSHREEFYKLYLKLTEIWSEENSPYERKKELYHSMAAVFLAYINKSSQMRAYLNKVHDLATLFQYGDNDSWLSLRQYFMQTADCLFDWNAVQGAVLPAEVVQKAHRYIEAYISTDISLNAIADHVGLNPSYFSRLYKQMTGIGLSDYIIDFRNLKAKELLIDSTMKVNEIAAALGYNSALAFIRFFKKQNETTPQEFRMLRIK
ncbi:response regulator [Paenibacillus alginolyticus]|uniref:response regulator transcription factor n=1 Tax=Paenibacillus alginolyticus TaxID=59839 RepID=UPI0003F6D38A|nr:response regulator [Paenibacillus alginolyticus]MCY9670008.1 response regulator [Paenibacillus alginolyticus]